MRLVLAFLPGVNPVLELLDPEEGKILSLPAFQSQQHWTLTAHWTTQHLELPLPEFGPPSGLLQALAYSLMHRVRRQNKERVRRMKAMTRPSGS